MNWWKAIGFGSYVLAWITRASADGKITQEEIIELVKQAITVFEIDVEIDTSPILPKS